MKAAEGRGTSSSSSSSDGSSRSSCNDDKVVPFVDTKLGERQTSNLSSGDVDSSRRKRGGSAGARDSVTTPAPADAETDCPIVAAAESAVSALSAQQELVTVAHGNAADGEAGEHQRLSQELGLPPTIHQDSEVYVGCF